jgi:hypothetical protein
MWETDLVSYNDHTIVHEFTALGKTFRSWTSGSTPCLQADAVVNVLQKCQKLFKRSVYIFQAESMRDVAFGCDWVGTSVTFHQCLIFIIATANKEFRLTAGKFVPVSNVTMMNVCIHVKMWADLRKWVEMNMVVYNFWVKKVKLLRRIYIITAISGWLTLKLTVTHESSLACWAWVKKA